jgi:hypothetical protein
MLPELTLRCLRHSAEVVTLVGVFGTSYSRNIDTSYSVLFADSISGSVELAIVQD